MIPLTKFLNPDDYPALAHWLSHLTRTQERLGELAPPFAHEHRQWEYAMALEAASAHPHPHTFLEFGGSDSLVMPTLQMAHGPDRTYTSVEHPSWANPANLERQRQQCPYPLHQLTALPAETFDVVLAVSVLENMEEPEKVSDPVWDGAEALGRTAAEVRNYRGQAQQLQVVKRLMRCVAPGGALFFTSDIMADTLNGDTAHFHWMRPKGIWNPTSWMSLFNAVLACGGWDALGIGADFTWSGPHVYDYSFASMGLRRKVPKAPETP